MSETLALPSVQETSSLYSLLRDRRTTRNFEDAPLTKLETATALWTCAGTTGQRRVRPSTRATYPLGETLVAGQVDGLAAGAYRYDPSHHALHPGSQGDPRETIVHATLDAADWLAVCPALLLLSADLASARSRFPDQPPEHGQEFLWIEMGLAAQNVYLWAAEHKLGTALIAGLDDACAKSACQPLIPLGHQLLCVIGIGHAAQ